jgi:hypothetical protein
VALALRTRDLNVTEVIASAFLAAVRATHNHFVVQNVRYFDSIRTYKKRRPQVVLARLFEMNLKA